MAEGLLKKAHPKTEVFSRALAYHADQVSPNAVKAMEELGVNITQHQPAPLRHEDLEKADLVLTMTKSQRDLLRGVVDSDKIYGFGEFLGRSEDVVDPYGMGTMEYRKAAAQLADWTQQLAVLIEEGAWEEK